MARIRSIKPEFFLDEELSSVPVLARLLFIGLWCLADREGRLEDKPKRIKAQILPWDPCDPDTLLSSLAATRLIIRYTAENGKNYIQIRNFTKHQAPHHREPPSVIPDPDQDVLNNAGEDATFSPKHVASSLPSRVVSGITDNGFQVDGIPSSDKPTRTRRTKVVDPWVERLAEEYRKRKIPLGVRWDSRAESWLRSSKPTEAEKDRVFRAIVKLLDQMPPRDFPFAGIGATLEGEKYLPFLEQESGAPGIPPGKPRIRDLEHLAELRLSPTFKAEDYANGQEMLERCRENPEVWRPIADAALARWKANEATAS